MLVRGIAPTFHNKTTDSIMFAFIHFTPLYSLIHTSIKNKNTVNYYYYGNAESLWSFVDIEANKKYN